MLLPLAVRWPWLCRADRYQLRLEGSPSLAASASHAALTVGRRSEKRRARRQCRVFRSETPGWRLEARRGFINGQIQGGKVGRGLDFSRLFGPSTLKPFLRMGSADYLRQLAPNKIEPNTLQNLSSSISIRAMQYYSIRPRLEQTPNPPSGRQSNSGSRASR
ncbi:hypothetical protein J3E68DRAFT_204340 [Trichoderma sp. SZMC 28012]